MTPYSSEELETFIVTLLKALTEAFGPPTSLRVLNEVEPHPIQGVAAIGHIIRRV